MESTFYSGILEKGWQKGRAEGRAEGKRETVARAVRQRLGEDTPLAQRLTHCEEALLDRVLDAVLGNSDPADLLTVLERLLPPRA